MCDLVSYSPPSQTGTRNGRLPVQPVAEEEQDYIRHTPRAS